MIVSNELARMLVGELYGVGDTTSDWNDSEWNDGTVYPNLEIVQSELVDTTRRSIVHERVYKDLHTGKYRRTSYRVSATARQDERPYENDGSEIQFVEVVPRETIKIKYVAV